MVDYFIEFLVERTNTNRWRRLRKYQYKRKNLLNCFVLKKGCGIRHCL